MKRIEDLSESELVKLTHEDILKYIDIECALEGVVMLPPIPGPKPINILPEFDTTIYKICGIVTINSEHAQRIFNAVVSEEIFYTEYKSPDYEIKYLKSIPRGSYSYPTIEIGNVFSLILWDQIKDEQAKFNAEKTKWEKANDEYKNALNERSEITQRVNEIVSEAVSLSYGRDQLRNDFKRYLELADGNHKIAFNFLEKAKDIHDYPELKDEFLQPELKDQVEG